MNDFNPSIKDIQEVQLVCYKCKSPEYLSVKKYDRQRQPVMICRSCRKITTYIQPSRSYKKMTTALDPEAWAKFAKEKNKKVMEAYR